MSVLSITSHRLREKMLDNRVASLDVQLESTKSKASSRDRLKITKKKLKKPLPKVKPPSELERVHLKKKSVRNHYFSSGINVNDDNQRDLLTEPSPFVYPKDLEFFSFDVMSKAWREKLKRKELSVKCAKKNNYRTRNELDVLNRMYAKEPETTGMKTLLDVDPDFFSLVEGRPLLGKFRIRKYVHDVREVLRTRIVTGFREDEVDLIEENFASEQNMIDKIRNAYQTYVDTFEEFLYNDHTSSMKLLRLSEKEANLAIDKYEEYRQLSKSYGTLKYTVYNLEEKWRNCKMYQKFLYLVSPVYWRRKHDYYHLQQKDSHMSLVSEMSTVFGRYRLPSSGDVLSLEALVDQFLDDCRTQEDPILFFQTPDQLMKVFRFIEIQNLNTLLHIEELAVPTENVKEGIENARLVFETEMNALKDVINNLEGGIVWEEQRADALEEYALELINGPFKDLVAEEEILNLYVFVEDVYENRVAPNDAKLGLADMMRAVEMKYRHYLVQLDALPRDQVKRAESECFADYAKIMKIAEEAAKKVVQIERLTRRLKKALEPPFERKYRELRFRSPPPKTKKVPPPPPRPLTADETDYLSFFTEYCNQTDSLSEFGIHLETDGTRGTDATDMLKDLVR